MSRFILLLEHNIDLIVLQVSVAMFKEYCVAFGNKVDIVVLLKNHEECLLQNRLEFSCVFFVKNKIF